jgi:DNA mismatch endonuclease, patch repair protein
MADVFTKEKRSAVMAKIKSHGNKDTELAMIKIFKDNHITGWRRHQVLLGKPDFTFWKNRVVVFVDGCFWHGCQLHSKIPQGNREFWEKKLAGNIERDKFVTNGLEQKKWKVIRIWEHDIKYSKKIAELITKGLTSK